MALGQVPATVSAGVICFALGLGLGAFGMFYLKFDPKKQAIGEGNMPKGETEFVAGSREKGGGFMGAGKKGGGFPGGGGKMGGGPRGGGTGGGSKVSLASLVATLDALTAKPLEIKLTDEQKTKLAQALKALDPDEDMSDEDATKKLNDVLKIVETNKETLEAAGFRWPGSPPPATRPTDGNPFGEGANKEHLKQLAERVGQKK